MQLSRHVLDKELTNAIKDCSERTDIWTTAYYNECAKDLEKKKDDFFDMISLLIERCKLSESDQNADILDNCDLFRIKIVTLWTEFLNLELVESPVSVFENYDMEQEASESVETVDEFVSDLMAKWSSSVKSNALAHKDVDTDFLGNLSDNKDKLSLSSNMPPSVGEVKKEIINVELPDTSTQIKSEPVTAKVEEPVIENNELLSLKKVDASGNFIVHKERQKKERPSCNDEGNNLLDQLKLVLNAQSAQVQSQTDLILNVLRFCMILF